MPIGERLKEERERLGLSQTDLGVAAGVARKSQFNYEIGLRSPDAEYLAKAALLGVDVRYVVTGEREYAPPEALGAEERVMLDYFRKASPEGRRAAMGALIGAATPSHGASKQVFHASVGRAIGDVTITHHARPSSSRKKT